MTARAVEKKLNNSYRKKKHYLQARAEAKWLNKQNINLNLVTQLIWLHRLFVKEGWTLKPRTIYKSINLGTTKREEN